MRTLRLILADWNLTILALCLLAACACSVMVVIALTQDRPGAAAFILLGESTLLPVALLHYSAHRRRVGR